MEEGKKRGDGGDGGGTGYKKLKGKTEASVIGESWSECGGGGSSNLGLLFGRKSSSWSFPGRLRRMRREEEAEEVMEEAKKGKRRMWRGQRRNGKRHFLMSPAAFLCDYILHKELAPDGPPPNLSSIKSLPQFLGKRDGGQEDEGNRLYRSESFRFLQKPPEAIKEEVQFARHRKIVGVCEIYSQPVDALTHPELWSHELNSRGPGNSGGELLLPGHDKSPGILPGTGPNNKTSPPQSFQTPSHYKHPKRSKERPPDFSRTFSPATPNYLPASHHLLNARNSSFPPRIDIITPIPGTSPNFPGIVPSLKISQHSPPPLRTDYHYENTKENYYQEIEYYSVPLYSSPTSPGLLLSGDSSWDSPYSSPPPPSHPPPPPPPQSPSPHINQGLYCSVNDDSSHSFDWDNYSPENSPENPGRHCPPRKPGRGTSLQKKNNKRPPRSDEELEEEDVTTGSDASPPSSHIRGDRIYPYTISSIPTTRSRIDSSKRRAKLPRNNKKLNGGRFKDKIRTEEARKKAEERYPGKSQKAGNGRNQLYYLISKLETPKDESYPLSTPLGCYYYCCCCRHPGDSPPEEDLDQRAGKMAKKRYETAFLPSNNPNLEAITSPDVDSLLLAIEATSLGEKLREEGRRLVIQEHHLCSAPEEQVGLVSGLPGRSNVFHVEESQKEVPGEDEGSKENAGHTSGSNNVLQLSLPMSEPLPVKQFGRRGEKQLGWDQFAGNQFGRNGERRSRKKMSLVKDNSISSLESLDSTKSDESFGECARGLPRGSGLKFQKILSPISDKSPLEPGMSLGNVSCGIYQPEVTQKIGRSSSPDLGVPHSTHTLDPWMRSSSAIASKTAPRPNHVSLLLTAAELTNVPWEMPKLRRKLALIADSGISLDMPPQNDLGTRDFGTSRGDIPRNPPKLTLNRGRSRTLSSDFWSGSSTGSSVDSAGAHGGGRLGLKLPLRSQQYPEVLIVHPGEEGGSQYLEDGEDDSDGDYLVPVKKPDRSRIWLDFPQPLDPTYTFDPDLDLECQEWFFGAITRSEAEDILRTTPEGSFLVRNCESSNFNQYSLSLKCARGFIHIRIEPSSLGTFTLGDQQFPSIPRLVLHFMTHRLPIKGAEHVQLVHPVINQLL